MGVLKLHHISPDATFQYGLLEHLRSLVRQDADPQVAANCLVVLMEVRHF